MEVLNKVFNTARPVKQFVGPACTKGATDPCKVCVIGPIQSMRKDRLMTCEEQLQKWVEGNPVHNDERDECCPDFSCCTGVIADKDVRERFAKAHREGDDKTKTEMLWMFMGNMLTTELPKEDVYIATGNPDTVVN